MEYANSDKLGLICNHHTIQADKSYNCKFDEQYAKHPICLRLAQEHGKAVDFAKSGIAPQIESHYLSKEYPDFM